MDTNDIERRIARLDIQDASPASKAPAWPWHGPGSGWSVAPRRRPETSAIVQGGVALPLPAGSAACSPCSSPDAWVRICLQRRRTSSRVACNSANRASVSIKVRSARSRSSSKRGGRGSESGEFDTATVLSRAGGRESCHRCKGRAVVVVWRVGAAGAWPRRREGRWRLGDGYCARGCCGR